MSEQNVFSDNELRVCIRKCSTCIYRPGNLMTLRDGRKESMEAEAVANLSVIPCHKTLGLEEQAVCRGFFDTQKHNGLLSAAERLGLVKEVDADAAALHRTGTGVHSGARSDTEADDPDR